MKPRQPAPCLTGSASIIQRRHQQWRAAEELTFLSRFHSLRQQKLQKNKSPTMSADAGVPPRCSSSFHWGRRIHRCHNKTLAAAEPANGEGREKREGAAQASAAELISGTNVTRPGSTRGRSPLPLLPSLLLWPHLPVWPRPLLSRTEANRLLQQHTHPSTRPPPGVSTKFLPLLRCCSHASVTFVGQEQSQVLCFYRNGEWMQTSHCIKGYFFIPLKGYRRSNLTSVM